LTARRYQLHETAFPPDPSRMSPRQKFGRVLVALASLIGVAASVYLLQVHASVSSGSAATGLCNMGETLNCTGAAQSVYATLFGVPIAALGLGFYAGALLVTLRAVRGDRGADVGALLGGLFAVSVAYSVFLAAVSVLQIGSLCPACVVLYAVNAAGLVGAVLWARPNVARAIAAVQQRAIVAPLLLTFVVVGGVGAVLSANGEEPSPAPHGESITSEQQALLLRPGAPSMGPADAPVVIVEFSDFECPFCSRLAASLAQVKDEYGDQVRVEFRQFPLEMHAHAGAAAKASLCAAEQDGFWAMHDALFENQRTLGPERWAEIAGELALDASALTSCMEREDIAAIVARDQADGAALAVRGTPAFFVNGVSYAGALPIEQLREIIDGALGVGE
jgi:protein-disulfide isomerase